MIITIGTRTFAVDQASGNEYQISEHGVSDVGYIVREDSGRFTYTTDNDAQGWANSLEGAAREYAAETRQVVGTDAGRRIAAHWQSPGRVGHVLAALASGRPVALDALAADARRTRDEMGRSGTVNAAMDTLMTDGYTDVTADGESDDDTERAHWLPMAD